MRVRLYKKTKDNLSYFQFIADNGEIVLNSQGYAEKDARNNGVQSVIANAGNTGRYDRQTSEDGKYFFILKAGNGQEIARSPEFDTTNALEAAIASCMEEIPGLTHADETETQASTSNPYSGSEGDDNYKPLAFYQERIRGVENGFDSFATDDGNFYFTLNIGGRIVLLSESYTSQDGRNNGTASVARNLPLPDRYQRKVHPNGKHYFNLLAGNNQQIATSVWFDTEAEMETAIRALQQGLFGGTEEVILKEAGEGVSGEIEGMTGYRASIDIATPPPAPRDATPKPKTKRKKREKKETTSEEKLYLKSGSYLFNDVTYQTMRSGNGRYYFSFRTGDDKALLIGANVQGYETEEEVNRAVQRVIELGPYEGNYEGKTTRNDKYYFYLKDTAGGYVAKSFFYDTAEEMQDAVGLLIGRTRVAAAAAPAALTTAGGEAIVDDYLPCERYNGEEGFHRFFNGEDESWYFAFNDANGNTILRSEAYKSEKARENGIESVRKNAPIEERWVKNQTPNGQYYFSLRAGNNQEIARTCYYETEDALLAVLRTAVGPLYVPPPPREVLQAPVVVDDYLPCEAYAGEAEDGYRRFTHEGEWYFAYNDKDGNTILRSEAYKSEKARENGIESVRKNAPIEERWVKNQTPDGQYYFSLRAGNNQEIARTCHYENEDALLAVLRTAVGPLYVPPPPREVLKAPIVVDDYLPCEAYAGEAEDGFRRFTHEGEWYFAYNDKDGNPILRSEGYKSEKARENGIESVKKNMPIEERWVKNKDDEGRYYYALRAANNQEIARSCYYQEEGAMLAAWGLLPALFFLPAVSRAAVAAPPPPPPPPPAPAPVPVSAPVVEKPKVVPPPPPAPTPVAASSGGFKWWWLLPLLLLPLLFLLFRGCDGCKSTAPVETTQVAPPPAPTQEQPAPEPTQEVVAPPPATPVCACKGSENPIFNIPTGKTPKTLTRLGTNPEFGNSHDVDAAGFFNKISDRYKTNAIDKRFLDDLFRAMGYANGFADANAGLFSEATVPAGTTGNMGYSPKHQTVYATLDPTSDRDRLAFRIKAANGCDVHFMKTCGNHFFFCPN